MDRVLFWLLVWGLGVLAILLWWHGRSRYLAGYTRAVDDLDDVRPHFDAAREGYQRDELVTQCSWCKRLETGKGIWTQLEEPRLVQAVSHGACPSCAKVRIMALKERVKHG